MSFASIPVVTGDEIVRLLPPAAAAAAIVTALKDGLDPRSDPERVGVDLPRGQLLLMPTHTPRSAGVKIATIAPDNPAHDLPRIQGVYVLFDPQTLAVRAILDGTALTNLRTPAVSAAVVTTLAERFTERARVVVFGAGPQAIGHTRALAAIDGLEMSELSYVVRNPNRAGIGASIDGVPTAVLAADSSDAQFAVRQADLIVCATTARTPLFDATDVRDGAVVIAVGSHEPDAREVGGALMCRSAVVVEDLQTALREAGDVAIPAKAGDLRRNAIIEMSDLITGRTQIAPSQAVVFKSTGMSWEDLVVADAVMTRRNEERN
jgi:ornithine cyclodeaminase/alanine dehydrogenase-like protein (mu-crystallin family)